MNTLERIIKINVLFFFCVLNTIDMVQTISFLKMGIEGNQLAVDQPYIWFALKLIIALGLPLGLYKLDLYLDKKEDEGVIIHLKLFIGLIYLVIFFADVFFFSLVLKNARLLAHLSP